MSKPPVFQNWVSFLKYAVIVLSSLGAAVSLLRNANFAIRYPAEYLKAAWSIRRGLTTQTSHGEVRFLGIMMIVGATFFLLVAYAFLPSMIQAWRIK
jgi:hypothetical protein